MTNLTSFYKYIGLVAALYILTTASAVILKDNFNLVDVVTIGKIFSLIMLLIVNGEIAKDIDKNQRDIKYSNYFILFLVVLITIVTAIKFLGLNIETSNVSEWMKHILQVAFKNIFWLSAFPLVAYALLDLYIAYIRKGSQNEKSVAKKFFVFVDLVCIFPLILIYMLTALYSQALSSAPQEIEVFTSGSMAIVLMSSAIAAKAVEEYFGDEAE